MNKKNLLASTFAGGVTATGIYSGVSTFGVASTGTAISTLSGVVAKKATLACLGGGALAVGGLGILGGILFLAIIAISVTAYVYSKLDKK